MNTLFAHPKRRHIFAGLAIGALLMQSPAPAAPASAAVTLSGVTVAVLPFGNADGDAATDYIADGMTDEVNLALSQVPGLTPMARISAYRFKGSKDEPRSIARTLGAAHFVTGTARPVASADGNRIRVSAKLIRTSDGMELWTENYYAELPAIFDIQNDIAKNIATALKLNPADNLVRNRTTNMEAYDGYLRARPLIRARNQKSFADAAVILEPIVAKEPGFAPATQLLAFDYDIAPLYNPALRSGQTAEARRFVESVVPKAEALAKRATELDPKRADAFVALGYANMVQNKMLAALPAFRQAIALDPNHPDGLHGYSQLLAALGRVDESIAIRRKMQALEPTFINYVADNAEIYWLGGENEPAIAMLEQFRPGRTLEMALIKSALGRYKEAAGNLREMGQGNYAPGVLEGAARLLEAAPAKAPPDAPRLGNLGWIFLFTGAPERVFEYYESNLGAGYFQPISTTWFWHPSWAPARKTERFKTYMRNIGFVDVWRAQGWPAQCKPVGANDFTCS